MKEASPRFRGIALLLAFLLGGFGAHRFYAGKIVTGVVQLILTISIVGLVVAISWVWVDLIRIIIGTFKGKQGRPITVWTN